MLPFPRAHYYVGAFLIATFAAFWPSYFAVLKESSFANHLHGITATLWIVLIMAQNWTIHNRKRSAHKWLGLSSLALIPFFTVGGLLTTQNMVTGDGMFTQMFGIRLSPADLVATFLVCLFFALALRNRRNVHRHSRYMLATITLLIGPVVGRIVNNYVPGFVIMGPQDLPKFAEGVTIAVGFAVILLAIMVWRDYRNGRPTLPFTLALIGTLVMYSGFFVWGDSDAWRAVTQAYAAVPASVLWLVGMAMGIVAGAWGWQAGKRPKKRAAPAATIPLGNPTA